MNDMQFNGKNSMNIMNIKKLGKSIIIVLIIFGIAYYISSFWFQFMLIQGNSMEPSYKNYQLVLLDKRDSVLKQGDVIVFQCDGLKAVLVKRIIACPGDTVQIVNGTLYVNGTAFKYPDVSYEGISYAGIAQNEIHLQENQFFVMGDNVEFSKDSRYQEVGCVSKEDILGIVIP